MVSAFAYHWRDPGSNPSSDKKKILKIYLIKMTRKKKNEKKWKKNLNKKIHTKKKKNEKFCSNIILIKYDLILRLYQPITLKIKKYKTDITLYALK